MSQSSKEKTRIGCNRAGFIVKQHIDQLVDRILRQASGIHKEAF